jgi:excinuclease ABC subunit C
VYRVPGYRGDERMYLIRKGLVRGEIPNPAGTVERRRAVEAVEAVFGSPAPEWEAFTPEAASEILLVARWFRLRKGELARVQGPEEWLGRSRGG